jgi:hypothetical protein
VKKCIIAEMENQVTRVDARMYAEIENKAM